MLSVENRLAPSPRTVCGCPVLFSMSRSLRERNLLNGRYSHRAQWTPDEASGDSRWTGPLCWEEFGGQCVPQALAAEGSGPWQVGVTCQLYPLSAPRPWARRPGDFHLLGHPACSPARCRSGVSLRACRKPWPSDSWRGSWQGAGKTCPASTLAAGACPEPCPPSTAPAPGRAAPERGTLPGAGLPCMELWGQARPGRALGRTVCTSRPEVCPTGPSRHLAPLVQTPRPATLSCSQGPPPTHADPRPGLPQARADPLSVQKLGLVTGRGRAPQRAPVTTHCQPSTVQHAHCKIQMVQQGTSCPPALRREARKLRRMCHAVPTRWHHHPQRHLGQGKSGQRGRGRGAACPHSRPLRQGSTPARSAGTASKLQGPRLQSPKLSGHWPAADEGCHH